MARRYWLLLIPLVASASPFLAFLGVLWFNQAYPPPIESESESWAAMAALVLIVILGLAVPLTGIVLSIIMRRTTVGAAAFIGLVLLVNLPLLVLQIGFPNVSLAIMLLPSTFELPTFVRIALAGVVAVGVYALLASLLFPFARRGVLRTAAVGTLLFAGTCAGVYERLLHSW
jgi:hypothetical protein